MGELAQPNVTQVVGSVEFTLFQDRKWFVEQAQIATDMESSVGHFGAGVRR